MRAFTGGAVLTMDGATAGAEVVLDHAGRIAGILTNDNVAEMMLIESVRPGWRFQRR